MMAQPWLYRPASLWPRAVLDVNWHTRNLEIAQAQRRAMPVRAARKNNAR